MTPAVGGVVKGNTRGGLTFLALLSFVTSFLIAHAFATLNPDIVIVSGGIHFHHFWYGLAMLSVAGWLGIVQDTAKFRRAYAVVFGLGAGLVGDEIGLLLTFGDYNSNLTFLFFIIVVTVGTMSMLLLRNKDDLEYDVIALGNHERLAYAGVVIAGLSTLAFAADLIPLGIGVAAAGAFIAIIGVLWHRKVGTS